MSATISRGRLALLAVNLSAVRLLGVLGALAALASACGGWTWD